jgi:hypothetical protein
MVTSSITSTNSILTNVTASSLFSSNTTSLNAVLTNTTINSLTSSRIFSPNANTIGNIFTTNGNVGIGIETPSYELDVVGSGHFSGDLVVDGSISGSGSASNTFSYLTLTATDESVSETSGSLITFGGITIQCPTDATSITSGGSFMTIGGAAIQKQLYVGLGIISVDGVNTIGSLITTGGNIGIGVNSPTEKLEILGNLKIDGDILATGGSTKTGSFENIGTSLLSSTENATGLGSGGNLTVLGGAAISKDTYIGGSLFIQGQDASLISGSTSVGSVASTGVYTLSNIPIGRTMGNTNYKIIGNLSTSSTQENVYIASFKNTTTTTFDAVIMRIDALYSAWTDPNLKLDWIILP